MHPWQIVDEFEQVVAKYARAPYGVAVDSCTNALFLSLLLTRLKRGKQEIVLPKRTYVGVAQSVINAGHTIRFIDWRWSGVYELHPTNVVDSARRFRRGMYREHTMWCLSFHWAKHLSIGRGGMILLDNEEDYKLLRRMRYDGRTERVAPADDVFNCPGYHMMASPELAAHGLLLMQNMHDYNKDLPWDNYPDLSKVEYFRNANK